MNNNLRNTWTRLACAAALCAAGTAANAATLTFDDPGLIDIDSAGVATYTEAGYTVSGPAASFLPLDSMLVGGFDATPFSLKAAAGGAFSFTGLHFSFYDLGFGTAPGMLSITGLRNGVTVAGLGLSVGPSASATFGVDWSNVTEVRFSGSSGFALDNVSAVPEPGAWALMAAGLGVLGLQARRRQRAG